MAGKRINLSDLADEPPLEEARVPAFADATPRSVRVEQVAANPLNTRDVHAHPENIASIADSIRVHGQLQPCTVVTRSAFLTIFPEHEALIGNASYVQVTGGRRRAAVVLAGIPDLDITVKNAVATTRAGFVSATAAENIDREDYDPVEEARAVQLLVHECGSGKAAAEQLARTPPWVTQRLNLLKLAQPVQDALCAGEIPLRDVRDLHRLPEDEQLALLAAWRQRSESRLTAVNRDSATGGPPAEALATPVRPRLSPTASAIRRLGGTPPKIAESLRAELPPDQLKELVEELLRDG